MKSPIVFFAASLLISSSLAQDSVESNDFPGPAFTYEQAHIPLAFSQAAYCRKANYLTQNYSGILAGFKATKVIENFKNGVEGFVGYLPSDNSIYIVYMGSETIENWLTNLNADKVHYTTFSDCYHCQVHDGFYSATKSVYPDVLLEVTRLRSIYPTAEIKTTGHSLGAALAHLTALELVNSGFVVTMTNFGQPRVGEVHMATYSNTKFSQYRVVHDADIVPHTPGTIWPESYWHTYYEMWEENTGVVRLAMILARISPAQTSTYSSALQTIWSTLARVWEHLAVLAP